MKKIEPAVETLADYQLTEADLSELTNLETTISRGLQTFWEVGNALLTIRDKRLYRSTHNSFETYCIKRWGFTDENARLLMRGSEVVANLQQTPTIVGVLPTNPSQVRSLTNLSPDQQRAAWQEAVTTAPNGKITGVYVKAIAQKYKTSKKPTSVAQETVALGEELGLLTRGDSTLPDSDRIDELTHTSPLDVDDRPGVWAGGAIAVPAEATLPTPTPEQWQAAQEKLAYYVEALAQAQVEISQLKSDRDHLHAQVESLQGLVENLTSENQVLEDKFRDLWTDSIGAYRRKVEELEGLTKENELLKRKLDTTAPSNKAATPRASDAHASELTRKQLGKFLGVSRQTIANWERDGELEKQGWVPIQGARPIRYRSTQNAQYAQQTWDAKVGSFLGEVANEQPQN